jgi:hypothetical protein
MKDSAADGKTEYTPAAPLLGRRDATHGRPVTSGQSIRERLSSTWNRGGTEMSNDNRDLLTVLRSELEFLEKGGYRTPARADWRPHFIFQDSATCLNFNPSQPPIM